VVVNRTMTPGDSCVERTQRVDRPNEASSPDTLNPDRAVAADEWANVASRNRGQTKRNHLPVWRAKKRQGSRRTNKSPLWNQDFCLFSIFDHQVGQRADLRGGTVAASFLTAFTPCCGMEAGTASAKAARCMASNKRNGWAIPPNAREYLEWVQLLGYSGPVKSLSDLRILQPPEHRKTATIRKINHGGE
jgi:hypothetical protein